MPDGTCSVDGCARSAFCRSWCKTHYNRWAKHGDVQADVPIRKTRPDAACSIEGCGRIGRLRDGLCPGHYLRRLKTGDVGTAVIPRRRHKIPAESVCTVDGCDRPDASRGWCAMHYARWQAYGDVMAHKPHRAERPKTVRPTRPKQVRPTECAAPDCTEPPFRRDWCSKHYQRVMRTGSTELKPKPTACSIEGCTRPWSRGDYCAVHYQRWYKHGDPHFLMRERNSKPPATCTLDGCEAPHYAKGMCRRHDLVARYEAKRDEILARNRAHYQQNREMYFAISARRRQRVRANMDALDRALSVEYRKAIAGDPCVYCGAPGEAVDHYFPLAKGGTDHWWNLRPACGGCNSSKAAHCGTWFVLQPKVNGVPIRRKVAA